MNNKTHSLLKFALVYVQISFVASSSGFDEEQLYPYHFHIVPNLSSVALGIANFISYHEFEWRKVVIITQDEDYFKMVRFLLHPCLMMISDPI